ncbi:hypothetical protein V6N12_062985 [Hibiscus sabdariffa]|uniref:Uncharacterized protein n=1 Tax=Hibiscus sabdariffa TaxID=183260 RepID=A0ABR2FAE5_9ROSI
MSPSFLLRIPLAKGDNQTFFCEGRTREDAIVVVAMVKFLKSNKVVIVLQGIMKCPSDVDLKEVVSVDALQTKKQMVLY